MERKFLEERESDVVIRLCIQNPVEHLSWQKLFAKIVNG